MVKKILKLWVVLIIALLALGACKSAEEQPEATPVDAQAVFTAAALTAEAQITEMAQITPTELATATPTDTPTATVVVTPTVAITPTQAIAYPTFDPNLVDRMEFVQDVTVPDYSAYAPDQPFKKVWRVRNAGTTTWTPEYSLLYASGEQMGALPFVALSGVTKPGETLDLAVDFVSPAAFGQHSSYWVLRNPVGRDVGLGGGNQPLYVIINVAANGTVVATATPIVAATISNITPTATTTSAPAGTYISSLTLQVDPPIYSGVCPREMKILAIIVMKQAATITLDLKAIVDTPGVKITMPEPYIKELQPGENKLGWRMGFTDSFVGRMFLQITSPENIVSDPVELDIKCTE